MKRNPTEEESARIADAIFANDRVEATNIYITACECGLTEAQEFVKRLTAELKESNPDIFAYKKPRKSHWLPL